MDQLKTEGYFTLYVGLWVSCKIKNRTQIITTKDGIETSTDLKITPHYLYKCLSETGLYVKPVLNYSYQKFAAKSFEKVVFHR